MARKRIRQFIVALPSGEGRVARTVVCLGWSAGRNATAPEDLSPGQVLSLTAPNQVIDREIFSLREACLKLVNAQGGIRGRRLKLVTADDDGLAATGLRQACRLADAEGVRALLGPEGSAPLNEALSPWAGRSGMPVVGPYGGEVGNRANEHRPGYFVTATLSAEGERLLAQLTSTDVHSIAIVRTRDFQGIAGLSALEEAPSVAGLTVVAMADVRTDGSTAAATVASLPGARPPALLLATTGSATAAILKALTWQRETRATSLPIHGRSCAATQAQFGALGRQAREMIMSHVVASPGIAQLAVVAACHVALQATVAEPSYALPCSCLPTCCGARHGTDARRCVEGAAARRRRQAWAVRGLVGPRSPRISLHRHRLVDPEGRIVR